jgi:protease-4
MSTAPRTRGPILRFFIGLWNAVNFTRRLVFNLVFLAVLFFIAGLLLADGSKREIAARTTLVIAPEGKLVEQFSADPISRALARASGDDGAGEVRLRDLLRAIDAAADDTRIARIYLRVDKLQAGGFASLREVAAALARARAAGKQVVAFGEGFDQGQYLLAAQANEVYLDPMGAVLLQGLGRYRLYFGSALRDRLGVDMHLFKVGTYKSAAEPYVLDAASPAAKEADLFWMNDVWTRYLQDIGRARKLAPAALAADVEALPAQVGQAHGDLAQMALDDKLVDGLKTEDQVNALLAERGAADADADGGFRQVGLDDYLADVRGNGGEFDRRPQVAVVVAEGEISGGKQPAGKIGGKSTSDLLHSLIDDEQVKAVVLRVDSPGGEVFASEQIRREVQALKAAGKPVVVSMGDVAASGGYWISMNADRIYADPSTITGSIGIFGLVPNFSGTLDKLGVASDGVATTPYAGAFDVTRPLDPAVGQMIQSVIEKGYRDFTGGVAKARGQSVAQIDAIAQGRVWSGAQARERGLVDAFGGVEQAAEDAARRARLGARAEWRLQYVDVPGTPFEQFVANLGNSRAGALLLGRSSLLRTLLAEAAPADLAPALSVFDAAAARARATGVPVQTIAFCFCGLDP